MTVSFKNLTCLGLSTLIGVILLSSKLAYAGGWVAHTTTKGCAAYFWEHSASANYVPPKVTFRWSGKCNADNEITGRGTLSFHDSDGFIASRTGMWIDGDRTGPNSLVTTRDREPFIQTFIAGCHDFDGECQDQPRTKKGSSSNASNTNTNSGAGGASKTARYGALAIDKAQGNTYGWAVDHTSLAQARDESVAQCNKVSASPCEMVLEFGNTCASYAIDAARSSTVYGWAHAPTRAEAEAAAIKFCTERGGSDSKCRMRVWGCTGNAAKSVKR
jgi:Domain of unknown function (DUF4189)